MIKQKLLQLFHLTRPSWVERHFIIILLVGVAVMMSMSLAIGMGQSVWFDEAYSIMLAKQPIGELLRLTGMDTHPPLYYMILKSWAGLFGWSELALRSFSVLAAGGAVVIGGLLVRRLFGIRAALITLSFIVLAPFLLRYGFEIRMYALASLIGVAATYVLVRALAAKGQSQWLLYAIYAALVALGVYTLYYTVLLWLAHFVWLAWLTYRQKQSIIKAPWLLAFVGGVLLFSPWLPTFLAQVSNGALAPISQAMTLTNLLGIVSFEFLYQPVWQLDAFESLLMVFVLLAVGYFAVRAFKLVEKKQRPYLVLLALYLLVPVVILTLVSLARPMYVERYLAHVVIGGLLFTGVAVAIVTKKSSPTIKMAGLLLPVIMLVGLANLVQAGNYNFQRLQKPTVDQAAMALEECKDGATILAADPYVAIELAYYVSQCQIHFYSETAQLSGGYAPLSESALRVANPAKDIRSDRDVLYVYYDEPKLQFSADLQMSKLEKYGSLNVATFSAE